MWYSWITVIIQVFYLQITGICWVNYWCIIGGYREWLRGSLYCLVLSVLWEVTVGYIAYDRLHITEYCVPEYKRNSKEQRQGNLPTWSNFSLGTVCLLPSNLHSCFDIASKSSHLILHTINSAHSARTMPHHPMLQHIVPFSNHTK